jgi:hypothetical protein
MLVAISTWTLWMAGGLGYRHAYMPAALGFAVMFTAWRSDIRVPISQSAILALLAIAWGFDGTAEPLLPLVTNRLREVRFNALLETITVVLLLVHLTVNAATARRQAEPTRA